MLRRFACAAACTLLALLGGATAFAQQVTVFSDNFEASSGLNTTNWPAVQRNYEGGSGTGFRSGVYNGQPQGYGASFPSYSLYFRSSGANRRGQMKTLDLSVGGAVLTFDLRYTPSTSSTGLPFDEFNTTNEEIIVEYTTNPGAGSPSYTQLVRFSRTNSSYANWGAVTINLPRAAWTTTTAVRWRQVSHSGNNYDQWAIDNVVMVVNPEPGTWALFGTGAAALAVVAARRRRTRGGPGRAADPAADPAPGAPAAVRRSRNSHVENPSLPCQDAARSASRPRSPASSPCEDCSPSSSSCSADRPPGRSRSPSSPTTSRPSRA